MLNLSHCKGFDTHRSGWSYVINSLKPYHSDTGILVDDFIEREFSWNYLNNGPDHSKIPYTQPWIGFLHNPHNMPKWFDSHHSPQSIFEREEFQQSLRTCRCIITLSEYLAEFVRQNTDVPVVSIKHPTSKKTKKWNSYKFFSEYNKKLVQIGYWLRDFKMFGELRVNQYKKYWLPSNISLIKPYLDHLYRSNQLKSTTLKGISVLDRISNSKYDDMLSTSVAFLKLYDSSANNAIIECIARDIPLVVNRHPAVVEYLGKDYPLYYNYKSSPKRIQSIIRDNELLFAGHEYLKNMDKSWMDGDRFAQDLIRKIKCYI